MRRFFGNDQNRGSNSALGYNIQRPTEDRYLMTREELENKMAALLGGRAAEMLAFDRLSTGASNDLDKATDIARSMVMRYGMDETAEKLLAKETLTAKELPQPV